VVVVYFEEKEYGFFEEVVVNHGGNVRNFLDLALVSKWSGIEEKAVVVK